MRAKPPTGSDNRLLRPTAFAQSRHVAVIHGQFGKSPFDRECVVGLGGLELPTKRLSVASSERSVRGPLMGISWLVKCPRWRSYVYKRLVCAKSRLSFTETVSAPLSLPQNSLSSHGGHNRQRLCSCVCDYCPGWRRPPRQPIGCSASKLPSSPDPPGQLIPG